MARLKDVDLNDRSVKFAGDYVDRRFKSGSQIEKNTVLNTIAHGFYMGARRYEELEDMGSFRRGLLGWRLKLSGSYLPVYPHLDEEWVNEESRRAATFYIKQKGYERMSTAEVALVRATLGVGFTNGFKARAQ